MANLNKIGIRRPEAAGEEVEALYFGSTGMEYSIHLSEVFGDHAVYIAAEHEDVGLVVWYSYDDKSEDTWTHAVNYLVWQNSQDD